LLIPSLLFGLLHSANPEIKEYGFFVMMSQYIILGLLLGFMSIMDDGIELAMGVHVVNNLFGSVLINFKGAALQTYALFEITEIRPVEEIFPLILSSILIISIFAYKYKWKYSLLNQKCEEHVENLEYQKEQ
jgi:membrane protease YdiL (CAAX protease family)